MKILPLETMGALENGYGRYWWPEGMYPEDMNKDPFKNVVVTILSQNTTEANCIRAYRGLASRFEVTPWSLASADEEELGEAIRSGGLYRVKARRIKQFSRAVLDDYGGDLSPILGMPKEEAKERLMELPGIGDKTADVLLTTRYSYREVIPVDTHMDRLAKRLGIVEPNAGYEDTQRALISFIPEAIRERASGLLWLLAKHTCKAGRPRCSECPIAGLCDHGQRTIRGK
jgi:endonuclease-3